MIIFTHIEKTAGTSFKTLLRGNFGVHHVESNKSKKEVFGRHDLSFAEKVFPGIKAISGHNLPDPVRNLGKEDLIPVTFLRKPEVRCVSHYQDQVLRNGLTSSFSEWILHKSNQNLMVRSIAGGEDLAKAKRILKEDYLFVGFTERFEESLKLMNLMLDRPLVLKYRRSVVARSDQIKEALLGEPETKELLERHNALDRDLYDFALTQIYLPLRKEMAEQLMETSEPARKFSPSFGLRHRASVIYNKFVYRQMIKLFRSGFKPD